MISVRKFAPLAAAIGMMFAGAAHADVVTSFNLLNGSGTTLVAGADALDWNERGSGVAIGVGPFSDSTVLPPGASFNFKYQANLASVSGGTPTADSLFLDNTSNGTAESIFKYEFTIVAKMHEVVTSSGVVGGKPTAFFGLTGAPSENKVAIFYDPMHNANTSTGTGFDDGTMIALLTIDSSGTTSQFSTVPGTGTGQGSAKLHASKSQAGDFINQDYLQGVEDFLFGMNFESDLNYPSGTSMTSGFHKGGSTQFADYSVTPADIVFKVDGSNRFTKVPEPGSILLMGVGMLGLFGAARRRNAKKA